MSNWLALIWKLNLGNSGGFTLPSVLCGETCLLASWCVGDRCGMPGSDEAWGKSNRLGAKNWRWSSTGRVLGGRTIERLADAVCDLYRAQEDEEHWFLGLALKPWLTISPSLASKPLARVSQFGLQNRQLWFGDLDHKITVMVSCFGP
jgi:hypothetical protein